MTEGDGPRTLVLLHGFPQTWWEWHGVIADFAEAGFRVVAPDYRGAGNSWKPAGGYDKRTMASDIQRLLRDHLRIEGKIVLAGHDIGLMVAYAYAQAYRDELSHLVLADAPLPGTGVFDRLRSDPRVWHFAFHGARDLPELLVQGRERQYLQFFFDARTTDPSATDIDVYVDAYSRSGRDARRLRGLPRVRPGRPRQPRGARAQRPARRRRCSRLAARSRRPGR